VGVANGDRVSSDGVCKQVSVTIGEERFFIDLYVLPLDDYELVLGCRWLKTLGPILWDFERHSMAFWRGAHRVKWRGLDAPTAPQCNAMERLDLMSLLLAEFSDLFAEPTGLPPQRHLDHRITLLPGTPPIAVRPYRYPHLLKDEIEKQ
jgi:hypothetical protein